MMTNESATLFHQVLSTDRMPSWERRFYPAVSWHCDFQAQMTENSLRYADLVQMRIPTEEVLEIAVGDKLVRGESMAQVPPPDAFTVTEVADNRRGSRAVWHWKVIAAWGGQRLR